MAFAAWLGCLAVTAGRLLRFAFPTMRIPLDSQRLLLQPGAPQEFRAQTIKG